MHVRCEVSYVMGIVSQKDIWNEEKSSLVIIIIVNLRHIHCSHPSPSLSPSSSPSSSLSDNYTTMLLANSRDDNDDNDDSSTLSSIYDFLYITTTTTTPSAAATSASALKALLITNRYLSFIARIIIIAKKDLKNSRRRINNIKKIHTPTISSRHCRRRHRRRRHRTSNCHHQQYDHQQLQDIQHQQEQEQEQLQQQHQQHQQHQQKQRRRRRIIHTPPPPHCSMLFRRLYNQQSIVFSLLTFLSVVPSLTVAAVMATIETEPSSSPTTMEESISLDLPVDAASRSLALLLLLLNIDGEDGEDDDNDDENDNYNYNDDNDNDDNDDNDDIDDIDEWEEESILQTHLISTDDDYKNTYNRNNNIGDDDDDDGDGDNNDRYHPFLVICTVDGDILVLNALDGSLICSFNSGLPLVGASEPLHDDDDDADHDNNHEKDEDRFGDGDDDYYQRQIVPGLDGQLYVTASDGFLKPLEITVLDVLANPVKTCKSKSNNSNNNNNNSNSNNNDHDDSDSDDGSSTANNNSDKDNDDNNSNYDDNGDHNSIECGIVTATKSTSLFALDATSGTLVWHQHPNGTTLKMDYNDDDDYDYNDNDIDDINNDDDIDIDIGSSSTRQRTKKRQPQKRKKESQQTKTTVLLQREDVIVQQISTSTGASVWNVTLGTLQALEFGGDTGGGRRGGSTSQGRGSMDDEFSNQLTSSPANNEQRGLLPTGEETENNGNNNEYNNDNNNNLLSAKLPKVIFSGDGTSLTAVHPSSGNNKVMWSREFPTTVASVFGLNGKSWEPLTVLDEQALLPENDIDNDQSFEMALINQFNNNDDGKEFFNSFHTELLINHGGRGDRDRLFQNAIRQHRRRQQSPPLLPSFSSSSKSMMFITSNDNGYHDDGIYYPSPSHHYKHQLQLPSPTDYQDLRRLFCLLPNSMCLSMGTQGLFLRWPIVLLATLCVAAIAIVTYRRFYEQIKKKKKEKRSKQMKRWEELRIASRVSRNSRASRVSFLDDDDNDHQVHSADNADLYGDLDSNDKLNSHIPPRSPQHRRRPRRASFAISSPMAPDSNPINNATATGNKEKNNNNDSNINIVSANGLIRSRSMPGNMNQHQRMSMVQMTPVNLNNERISPYGSPKVDGIAAIASPPAMLPLEAQTSHGVGLIDGTIPLIQYTRYASEFEEIGALGKGGFGSVFQCRNALDKRDYAIKKVLIRCDAKLPQIEFSRRLKRTLREVKSLASLDHSNIVRYYTAWLELEQANHNDNNHSVVGPCSDYYLMSPSCGNDISEIRSPTWKENILTNPFGSGGGLPSVLDHSFSSSRDDDRVIPGISEELDDIGFVFDRSEGEKPCANPDVRKVEEAIDESTSKIDALFPRSNRLNYGTAFQSFRSSQSSVEESSVGWSRESINQSDATGEENKSKSNSATKESTTAAETSTSQRYMLYIQMQFCSQKTLADFLSNEEARKGPSGSSIGGVDIPYALNLFLQTCQGVKHVHTQCLIHRDLKPNNVFIDDTGAVKVGDFGLSRESSDNSGESEAEPALTGAENYSYNGDITAGVGTRSYASPEQMKGGSDYDSSTDIYSLGIILFELCFPMYTGMERNIVLTKLRNHILPDQWMESVAVDFPKLHTLLLSMISNKPEDRPDAAAVVRTVQSILEGFTISSLDRRDCEGSILLRVETLFRENGLHQTMDLLRQAALPVLIDIVQYGLRSGTNQGEMKSIMEFAIVPRPQQEEVDATKCSPSSIGEVLVKTLSDNPQVLLIRQVSATKYT